MKKILVVDDNQDVIELLEKALRFYNYEVTAAKNGLEAVETAGMLKPDIILMDMFMPEMDGFEATSRIRSNPKTKHIPIIGTTASPRDRERCLVTGCDDCIVKPYSFVKLTGAIKETLARAKAMYT